MLNKLLFLNALFLLFLLFFGFQIGGINTRWIATALLCIESVFFIGKKTKQWIRWGPVRKMFLRLVIYVAVVLTITYIHGVGDLTYFSSCLRLVIFYLMLVLLWFVAPNNYKNRLTELLIYIFFVQSLIIITAFFIPQFLQIVRSFQYENMTEITDRYLNNGTFRGLALAAEQFHGLTVSFGLVAILALQKYKVTGHIQWILMFLLLFIANLFVGRTGMFGFFIALACYIISSGKKVIMSTLKFGIVVPLFVFAIYEAIPDTTKAVLDESVFSWAFQMFYNYGETGRFETSSSSDVLKMWQVSYNIKTFLFGDGQFMNSDGTYYMHTDVGYFRQMFYGGVFFAIYSIVFVYKTMIKRLKGHVFEFGMFAFLLIAHAKGLDIMYAVEPMMIVFVLYIDNNLKTKIYEYTKN